MDTINSFKGYGKVDPREEQAFRRKTRNRLIILIVSLVILVVVIGAVVGTVVNKRRDSDDKTPSSTQTSPTTALKLVCSATQYPDSCFSSISQLDKSNTTDPEQIFKLSLQVVQDSLSNLTSLPATLMSKTNVKDVKSALSVCQDVFDHAIDSLGDCMSAMEVNDGEKLLSLPKINDLKTWLSTTVTDQETCLDALEEANSTLVSEVKSLMQNSTEYASNSLAIVSKILTILGSINVPIHRKLLGETDSSSQVSDFPEWVRPGDRRLLQVANPKPNVTVAQDGSGDVKTISEAVAMVPNKSPTRFVIYVKKGVYVETVNMSKSAWNVMMYGDGKTLSVVSGSLNFIDGTPTFSTATFTVVGKGFMAVNMGFKNTAGASKHQAVAFRSASDLSVYYRCSFDGFQDTLYAFANRQFYRECDISGTIDFIFGNAAAVFQNCNILPRQPLANQFNTITAQGKKDPNQNAGFSIQACAISPLDHVTANTYLGRPWKDYSTTIFMQSQIDQFLNPQGWIEWLPGTVPPKTIFYAEYKNTGPGANVNQRVAWAGVYTSLTIDQASKYTVQNFIQGTDWLPGTNVLFQSSL